ncbi:MAG: tetratricopeptide repeat protein [Spirochaetota bacterium]
MKNLNIFLLIIIFLFSLCFPFSVLRATGGDPFTHFSMGYYHMYNGDLEKAKSHFEQCLQQEQWRSSTVYTILSRICSNLDQQQEAKKYARKAIQVDPYNQESLRFLALLLYEEGEYEKSLTYLKRLSELQQGDIQVLFYLAEVYNKLGQTEELIRVYKKINAIDPEILDVHLNLGHLYIQKGLLEQARKEYQKVLELDPENEKAIFYLTYIYLSEGKTEDTLKLFKKLDKKQLLNDSMLEDYAANLFVENQDPLPLIEKIEDKENIKPATRGIISYIRGDFQTAKQYFEEAVQKDQGNLAACTGLIRIAQKKNNQDMEKKWRFVLAGNYYELGRYQKALDEALHIKRMDQEYLENRYLLGDVYSAMGKTRQAIDQYRYFEKHSPNKADVYLKLGICYDEIEEHRKAIQSFISAARISPENDRIYYYLGIEYRILKEYEKAVDAFSRALELKGDDAKYLFNLGVCYERMDQIDKAIYYLDKSVGLDDSNPSSLNYLGYLLADKGIRLQDAKKYIEKALSMDPRNGAYLDSMGWVCYRLSQYQKAKQYLEQAVQYIDFSYQENYLILDHLGDVYYQIGQISEAVEAWGKALEIKETEEISKKIEKAKKELKN